MRNNNKKNKGGQKGGGEGGAGGKDNRGKEVWFCFVFLKKNTGTDAYLWPCVRDALCDKGK